MRILITGGAGFIGTNLIVKLMGDHTISSIDNYSTGKKENHHEGVEYVEGDIFDIKNNFNPEFDIVFHLAAKARGESHVGTKPYICWSIPLRLQWVDDVESWLLSSHTRGDWGGDDDWLVWWCIDTSSEDIPFTVAWNNESPLYQRHEEEIATMQALEELEPEPLFELLDHLWERKPQVVTPVEITWG